MDKLEDKVKEVLEQLRPALHAHSGDLEFVSFDEASKLLKLKLTGHCAGCMYSQMTLKNGIEQALKEAVDSEIVVENV